MARNGPGIRYTARVLRMRLAIASGKLEKYRLQGSVHRGALEQPQTLPTVGILTRVEAAEKDEMSSHVQSETLGMLALACQRSCDR